MCGRRRSGEGPRKPGMKESFDSLVEHLMTSGFFLEEAVEILETTLIMHALKRTEWNRTEASKLLGIHRNTLQRKMRDYKLKEQPPARKAPQKARPLARRAASN